MPTKISGTFDVSMLPQPDTEKNGATGLSRYALDKRYHGKLEGTSLGEMIAAMTKVKGSAGYVALEHFTGQLEGRTGSFHLQHHGLMDHGASTLSVVVVPDSAAGELAGLRGTMAIINSAEGHSYEFEYTLPPQR